jgi:hypothetical protein
VLSAPAAELEVLASTLLVAPGTPLIVVAVHVTCTIARQVSTTAKLPYMLDHKTCKKEGGRMLQSRCTRQIHTRSLAAWHMFPHQVLLQPMPTHRFTGALKFPCCVRVARGCDSAGVAEGVAVDVLCSSGRQDASAHQGNSEQLVLHPQLHLSSPSGIDWTGRPHAAVSTSEGTTPRLHR